MKILYLSPEHVSGTLTLWADEHRRRGNECRFVTLFPNPYGFQEDICLRLPMQPDSMTRIRMRRIVYKMTRGPKGEQTDIQEKPPFWKENSLFEKYFFALRDRLTAPRIEKAIRENDLDSFDIIHLDQGAGFFRDARVIKRWFEQGKKIVAFYHGNDMRNRGIFPAIDKCLGLRLTSELDLLYLDDRLKYLFLPVDTSLYTQPQKAETKILKIGHSARNTFKGTETIVKIVRKLEQKYPVQLVLISGVSHAVAMQMKQDCDIAIDQIADTAGWGYGMSGVEYLCLGIPTCTRINDEYARFIPDHPFVPVTADTLEQELIRLIEDEGYRLRKGRESRDWVVKYHDIRSVGDQLYRYYEELGWM